MASKNNTEKLSKIKIKNCTDRKIIYINARSVLKNFEKIELLATKLKPNIIMCSEARLTKEIAGSEYQISGYNCIECYSENRHTGGVTMYITKDIKHKIIQNTAIDKILWFLSVEIWDSGINGIYSVFYRSPQCGG